MKKLFIFVCLLLSTNVFANLKQFSPISWGISKSGEVVTYTNSSADVIKVQVTVNDSTVGGDSATVQCPHMAAAVVAMYSGIVCSLYSGESLTISDPASTFQHGAYGMYQAQ